MRIVHVVYSLEMGGAEVLVAQLCRIQREQGHEVSVCAYSQLGAVGEGLVADGFTVHVPGEAHPAKTMWHYFQYFRHLRPDVVHCHNPAPTLQAAMSGRLAGARSVVATRHSLVAPPYDRAAEIKFSVMALFCDWVVGICEITCANLRGAPLARRSRIVRVYNGAAAIPRRTSTRSETGGTSALRMLFIGRLAAIKDLGTMIRAVALATEQVPSIQLSIVGDGPVRAELETLAESLGVSERVRFMGQQMDTAHFYNEADVFVMSSVSEGLPMSLLQAMSVGLPALVTDVGGMAEVVREAGSGLLVPVGDSAAMARAMASLAGDSGLRAALGENASQAYEAQFTLQRMNEGYVRLYGKLPA